MKKIAILFLCIIMGMSALTGCGSEEEETTEETKVNDPKIVGTWAEDFFDSGYIFNDDGTGEDTFWELKFTYTAYDGNLTVYYDSDTYGASTYSYSIKDNQLTMTRTDGQDNDTFTYDKVEEETSEETTVTVQAEGSDVQAVETYAEAEAPVEEGEYEEEYYEEYAEEYNEEYAEEYNEEYNEEYVDGE